MRRSNAVILLTSLLALPSIASAQESRPEGAAVQEHPVQVALFFPVQAFPETDAIRGIRISFLYGKNIDVTGFDWGLVSHTTRSFLGVQIGGVGIAEGSFTGVQANTVLNFVRGSFVGLQTGAVNSVETGEGVQLSGVSVARQFRGLQIGFVNYAESLNGVQLGFVNIIKHGGAFPVFPIVNWGRGSSVPE